MTSIKAEPLQEPQPQLKPLCLFCNSPIPQTIHRGRTRLFCGRACKFKHWKTTHSERYKALVTSKNIGYRRALILKWNSLNLCRNCGRTRAEGFTTCESCHEKLRNYYLFYNNKLINEAKKDEPKDL